MDPLAALGVLASVRTDEIVVLHEANRLDWPQVSARPELDIPFVGAMGKASSFGLGLALARPDQRVWVLDGDGALLMNLGTLVTIGDAAPANLVHFVYNNAAYDMTGGQPTPGAGVVDFAAAALACGYRRAFSFSDSAALTAAIAVVLTGPHPTLVDLKVASLGRRTGRAPRTTLQAYNDLKSYLAHLPVGAPAFPR